MIRILLGLLLVLCFACPAKADIPLSIAGITLGTSLSEYEDMLQMQTLQADRDALFVNEVSLRDNAINCIRGGSLITGNCTGDDKIIGIKLKFADRSKSLYERLEKEYKQRFGKPTRWIGDPFHNVIAWEWIIREGDDVLSITLSYSVVSDMRPGVSIKMLLRSAWDKESVCYSEKHSRKKHKGMRNILVDDLSPFIPHH